MSNIKYILKFKRGESFVVDVLVTKKEDFIFENMITPPNTTLEIREQFLYDAEIAAINYMFEKEAKDYAATN